MVDATLGSDGWNANKRSARCVRRDKRRSVGDEDGSVLTEFFFSWLCSILSGQVAQLRESVQTLCRASNPLGKVIDYIQEDVDSMRKEMQQWRKEVQENTANLADKTRYVGRS